MIGRQKKLHMRYSYILGLLIFIFSSCSSNYDTGYGKFIDNLDPITIEEQIRINFERPDLPIYNPHKLVANDENLIVVDSENWTLHLMDLQGDILASTGSIGQGPNEYQAINQIYISENNQLYLYDSPSNRITNQSITNSNFNLKSEISIPNYDSLRLEGIYPANSAYFGVLKQSNFGGNRQSGYEVYRLGEDLQLQNHLFSMPGSETYTSQQGFERENPLGRKTIWGVAGGKFYYSTTDDLSVTSVNIESGDTMVYDFSEVPKPVKGEEEIEAIESRLRVQENSEISQLIREGSDLPYFINFTPTKIIFTIPCLGQAPQTERYCKLTKKRKK